MNARDPAKVIALAIVRHPALLVAHNNVHLCAGKLVQAVVVIHVVATVGNLALQTAAQSVKPLVCLVAKIVASAHAQVGAAMGVAVVAKVIAEERVVANVD